MGNIIIRHLSVTWSMLTVSSESIRPDGKCSAMIGRKRASRSWTVRNPQSSGPGSGLQDQVQVSRKPQEHGLSGTLKSPRPGSGLKDQIQVSRISQVSRKSQSDSSKQIFVLKPKFKWQKRKNKVYDNRI